METVFYHLISCSNYKSGEMHFDLNLDMASLCEEVSQHFENAISRSRDNLTWTVEGIKEVIAHDIVTPSNSFNASYPSDGEDVIRLFYTDSTGNMTQFTVDRIADELAAYIFENWSE